jgi:hypothetical protein
MALKKGQRVRFRPTHHKELELTGSVKRVYEDNSVDVKSDAGNGSISRLYSAHASDCSVIEEENTEAAPEPEEEEETGEEDLSGVE